eukprot:UN10039
MKITINTDLSKFDKSDGIGRNHDFCTEMCSLSSEEHICADFRPYISICNFYKFQKIHRTFAQKHMYMEKMKSANFDWLKLRSKITIMGGKVTYLVVFVL